MCVDSIAGASGRIQNGAKVSSRVHKKDEDWSDMQQNISINLRVDSFKDTPPVPFNPLENKFQLNAFLPITFIISNRKHNPHNILQEQHNHILIKITASPFPRDNCLASPTTHSHDSNSIP